MTVWRPTCYDGIEISDMGVLRWSATRAVIRPHSFATKKRGPVYQRFRRHYVHQLVLETFVGPRPEGRQCRHLNGNSLDNRLENLSWGTASEDNYDRVRHGTHQHARKIHCKNGHQFDGHNGKQRTCSQCQKMHNRAKKDRQREARTHCPQGHQFDGIRFNADGSVRQRYCTVCVDRQLAQGRDTRYG